MISSLNSTWSCLCFYFSRTLPNRHWAPECVQGSPMTSKMSPKSIQDLIFSKVGHVWKEGAEKHERFNFLIPFWTFLHAQKMKCFLPWTLPALASMSTSQESSQGDIWTQRRRRSSSRKKSLRNELSFPEYKWFLPRTLPDLAFVSTSQDRSQENIEHKNVPQGSPISSKISPKSRQNLIFSKKGHVCEHGTKKTWKSQFPQSVLDTFSCSKDEVISSLNSTCSCL